VRRWIIIVVGLSAVVVLFLLLRPGDEPEPSASPTPSTAATPTTPGETPASPTPTDRNDALEIEAEVEEGRVALEVEGQPVTGPRRVPVEAGTRVEIEVKSDTTDEVHVHVYDLKADVGPDRRGRVRFVADITGIIEVELEEAGLLLFRLEVSP
jgi:hypothetical protein